MPRTIDYAETSCIWPRRRNDSPEQGVLKGDAFALLDRIGESFLRLIREEEKLGKDENENNQVPSRECRKRTH